MPATRMPRRRSQRPTASHSERIGKPTAKTFGDDLLPSVIRRTVRTAGRPKGGSRRGRSTLPGDGAASGTPTWPGRPRGGTTPRGAAGSGRGRARRRGGRRVRVRRLGRRLPARGGRPLGGAAGTWPGLPARHLRADAVGDGPRVLGPERGTAGSLRRLDVPRPRGRGVQRPGRRLADLRQRAAAQGREVVRARGAGDRRRVRVLAPDPCRPRPALRPGRAAAGSHAVPVRRHDGEDGGSP